MRLKGGDPYVFGRGGEEAEALVAAGVPYEVVPGVTSAIAAPAYAGIPVTHRDVTPAFTVITGHEDPTKEESTVPWSALATGADTLVFLMGVGRLPLIARRLIAHGRPSATPVAVVRPGTWPDQQVVVGTLDDIAERVEEIGLTAPAVTVVGRVVALAGTLGWSGDAPLAGRRVLVTRAREQASALSALLRSFGASAVEFPAIRIVPAEDYADLDRALAELSAYRWACFTSVNAVAAVDRRLDAIGHPWHVSEAHPPRGNRTGHGARAAGAWLPGGVYTGAFSGRGDRRRTTAGRGCADPAGARRYRGRAFGRGPGGAWRAGGSIRGLSHAGDQRGCHGTRRVSGPGRDRHCHLRQFLHGAQPVSRAWRSSARVCWPRR